MEKQMRGEMRRREGKDEEEGIYGKQEKNGRREKDKEGHTNEFESKEQGYVFSLHLSLVTAIRVTKIIVFY